MKKREGSLAEVLDLKRRFSAADVVSWRQSAPYRLVLVYAVAYLLKVRTVEAEKQPLLGNGPYTRSR
jgi:hypothetical protein